MIKNNKKAQSMPINVIIIATLGLMVLVVVSILFTRQTSKTVSTLESCSGIGGQCRIICLNGEEEKSDSTCSTTKGEKTTKCCIKIFEDKR